MSQEQIIQHSLVPNVGEGTLAMKKSSETYRFWLGTLKSNNGNKEHVFDTDKKDGLLSRCGTAHFENCHSHKGICDKKLDLMVKTNPAEMCKRCRMSVCFEIWKEHKRDS